MIELVFTACLLADMKHCQEKSLQFMEENLTPMRCLMGAQPELAKWAEGHPKWAIMKWSCQKKKFENI